MIPDKPKNNIYEEAIILIATSIVLAYLLYSII